MRLAAAIVATFAAALAAGLAALWLLARPPEPEAFYNQPAPAGAKPGDLIAAEPFARALPSNSRSWRILYATTRGDGSAAAASAIVVVAQGDVSPRPVVAWAHGTTGIARGCAPSVMNNPFLNVPAVPGLLAEGWAYVATDYIGLGTPGRHAYLVGDEAARGVLDAVRAAGKIPGLRLDRRTVVWGHSQGGHAALWTGHRARAYAPEVDLLGIAALAPATDLPALLSASRSSMFGKIVSAYVSAAQEGGGDSGWISRDIASRCVGEWPTLVSALQTTILPSSGQDIDSRLDARLRAEVPKGPFAAPVLIAQGEADDLVLPAIQRGYVASLCAAGDPVALKAYPGRDHVSLVGPDSPLTADLISWTRDRFKGQPAAGACPASGR